MLKTLENLYNPKEDKIKIWSKTEPEKRGGVSIEVH